MNISMLIMQYSRSFVYLGILLLMYSNVCCVANVYNVILVTYSTAFVVITNHRNIRIYINAIVFKINENIHCIYKYPLHLLL